MEGFLGLSNQMLIRVSPGDYKALRYFPSETDKCA